VRIRVASALASVCFVAACGGHAERPVPVGEWKAVINDWYDNGRFDHPHSCAAVREAERRLPDDGGAYSDPRGDLRRYEAKRC
jgi:hypothetical protein